MDVAFKKQIAKLKRMQSNFNQGEKYVIEAQKLKEMAVNCPEEDKSELGDLILQLLDEGLTKMELTLRAFKQKQDSSVVTVNNEQYDMRHWATVTQYAKLFGYKNIQSVSNKIARGTIPAKDIVLIPELDIKLIRLP